VKFEMQAGDLASSAAYAAAAIAGKPQQPVLAGMKITADADGVSFTGSDGDTAAVATEMASVGETGDVVVPGTMFAGITKGLPPGGQVTLTAQGTTILLEYGRGEYELVTLDTGLYPEPPAPAQPAGRAPADLLATAVSRAEIAVARDDAIMALTAIQMIVDENEITFNSTNRYRFVQASLAWSADTDTVRDIRPALIPARILPALMKAVPAEKEMSVGVTPAGMVTFAGPGRSLTCRVTADDGFPVAGRQFGKYVPVATAVTDRKALQDAAARVSAVLSGREDRLKPVRLEFIPGQVRVSAGGANSGSETIYAELDGEPQDWPAFRPEYLQQVLEAAGTEKVALGFTAPRQPVLVTDGAQEKAPGSSFRFLVMPQFDLEPQS